MARILIVEDEPNNAEIVVRLLRRKGHDPFLAGNACDALRLAQEQRPDLILMDITIPPAEGETPHIEGGLDATRAIKSHPETAAIPVLALSARSMPHERHAMREAGCNDVAMKPYDFGQLLAQIDALLM